MQNPGGAAAHVTKKGNTALMWACYNKMEGVALKLIETGHSKPEQVNRRGNTALIWACQNNMEQVIPILQRLGGHEGQQQNYNQQQPLNNFVYQPPIKCTLKSGDFVSGHHLLQNNIYRTCGKAAGEHEAGYSVPQQLNAQVLSTLNADIRPNDSVSIIDKSHIGSYGTGSYLGSTSGQKPAIQSVIGAPSYF